MALHPEGFVGSDGVGHAPVVLGLDHEHVDVGDLVPVEVLVFQRRHYGVGWGPSRPARSPTIWDAQCGGFGKWVARYRQDDDWFVNASRGPQVPAGAAAELVALVLLARQQLREDPPAQRGAGAVAWQLTRMGCPDGAAAFAAA